MQLKVKGIARYPHLAKPSAPRGTEQFRYSVELLIHKADLQCKEVSKALDEVIKNAYPSGVPSSFHFCFTDLAISEPDNEALRDYMSLRTSINADRDRPQVVDMQMKPIIDPTIDSTLSGKIIWISGGISTYSQVTKGVKVYLNAVLVTNEMGVLPIQSISTKPSIEQMFGDITDSVSYGSPILVSPPDSLPKYQMTVKANGISRDEYIKAGWSDEMLISQGYMLPPNGVNPSFA